MQARSDHWRRTGKTIAFVPTMGFLHDGHISLLKEGRKRGDDLVLSIFVNPTQFGPNEDLDAYPKSLERDLSLAEQEGVNAVFTPNKEQLYGENYQTGVELEKLPGHLCGLSRPVHFRGVATVVTKLFNIVKPNISIFGQKDFQQLAVIRQMTSDLNFDIEIIGAPTVREPDGLAMSSRNTYLTEEQRTSALTLYKSLMMSQDMIKNGERDPGQIIKKVTTFITSHPNTEIDYISLCDPVTLDNLTSTIKKTALMALAVKVGKPRLIDNMLLTV